MKKQMMPRKSRIAQKGSKPLSPALFFGFLMICFPFALGAGAGIIAANSLDANVTDLFQSQMAESIAHILSGTYEPTAFLSVFWQTGRYVIFAFLLGFSLIGVVALPILASVQGFYFSFSIALFVRIFGSAGFLTCVAFFGASALFIVPCFFLIGAQSFVAARSLFSALLHGQPLRLGEVFHKSFLLRGFIAALFICATSMFERHLTPLILIWAESFLVL